MNKPRLLTLAVVVLLILNIGTLIYLFTSRGRNEQSNRPDAVSEFIIERLKLDARQQEQFAMLREKHRNIMQGAHREDRELHDQYFALLKNENPDKQKVDSLIKLMVDQRSIIESANFDHFESLRKICREDQKRLFDATIDEIARRLGPKGPGPGGPPHD